MYYILIGVIVLVVAIDFYVKNKNKKSDSTDIDKNNENKKKKNFSIFPYAIIFFIVFFSITIHFQHEYVRVQFMKDLEPVSEILQNEKYASAVQDDYCLLILNKCKDDLKNRSIANKLFAYFNKSYNSTDLIDYSDNLIKLVHKKKKTYKTSFAL